MQLLLIVFFAVLPFLTGFRLAPAQTRPRAFLTQMALPAEQKKDKRVVIVGATGYIGKFVVKESIRRGYETVAVMRDSSAPKDDFFKGCEVVYGDVTDEASLRANVFNRKADVVISCLASRSGTKVRRTVKKELRAISHTLSPRSLLTPLTHFNTNPPLQSDSFKIDYQATLNTLNAARATNAGQFILLSAFCVRKVRAKLCANLPLATPSPIVAVAAVTARQAVRQPAAVYEPPALCADMR